MPPGAATASRSPGGETAGAREAIVDSLVTLGFAPVGLVRRAPGRHVLDLTRCPFTDAVTASPNGRRVCHLHHGLLAGVAAASGRGGRRVRHQRSAGRAMPRRASAAEAGAAGVSARVRPASRRSSAGRRTARRGAVLILTEKRAVVELCTCYGEHVETLRSSDPELLRYLAGRE